MASIKLDQESTPLLAGLAISNPDIDGVQRQEWKLGLALAGISGVLFTANNFLIQYFEVDSLEMLLVRSVVQVVVLGIIVASESGISDVMAEMSPARSWLVHFFVGLQAIFGAFRLYFNFTCLQYMPLGDALTIIFTEPLFTMVLSLIFLKIAMGPWKILLGIGLTAGMILSIQPPFLFPPTVPLTPLSNSSHHVLVEGKIQRSEQYFYGACLAISCALCGAMCNILIKKCDGISSTSLVFVAGIAGILISVVGCVLDETDHIISSMEELTPMTWFILLVLSFIGVLAYLSMTEALKAISPTSVSVLRALEIILAYFCQIMFLGQYPNLTCVAGAFLVMLSVVGIAIEEKLQGGSHRGPARDTTGSPLEDPIPIPGAEYTSIDTLPSEEFRALV
ncbi:hypothetical protein TCAL_03122 [Tigriopus californicus]|uniref:EamA domain-containing protein n=1 Tax=Tigriopus californicus TaxID=6832 RepID=A0A553P1Z2_TIGCA|nr:solute carrier family 35 member G1-like [Tigriopus californicus]TRY71642.1 hypothetical protein TCAL_03122 [Tigriopus californicus]|eukprot:TCALIF_03122-PA protein Name:"Similar to SLC35G1 Solute carrier family 35 member G1 (Homo sapiens)" AED:0.08 eAED:0.08 QI:0/-1/0/1/-1/1/1/0/393